MYHPHAADALFVRLADKRAQGFTGLVGAQAVQVDLALDAPVAPAQLARHLHPDAGAAKAQGVVGVQQRADVEIVADRVAQHLCFVALVLHGHRGRWGGCEVHHGLAAQRAGGAYGLGEEVLFSQPPLLRSRTGSSFCRTAGLLLGQRGLHLPEVGQAFENRGLGGHAWECRTQGIHPAGTGSVRGEPGVHLGPEGGADHGLRL